MIVQVTRAHFITGPVQLAITHDEAHAFEDKELHARMCLADTQRPAMALECQGVQKSLQAYSAMTALLKACTGGLMQLAKHKLTLRTAEPRYQPA